MNSHSVTRLTKVHPLLADKVVTLIVNLEAQGITVEVVQGLRTYAEQNALYAQGRLRQGPVVTNAKGGQSNHNFGLAVDLCPFQNGKPAWNYNQGFNMIGVEAKKQGLRWGGDWNKFVDTPHIELPGPTLAQCRTLFNQGGLLKVWAALEDK